MAGDVLTSEQIFYFVLLHIFTIFLMVILKYIFTFIQWFRYIILMTLEEKAE